MAKNLEPMANMSPFFFNHVEVFSRCFLYFHLVRSYHQLLQKQMQFLQAFSSMSKSTRFGFNNDIKLPRQQKSLIRLKEK